MEEKQRKKRFDKDFKISTVKMLLEGNQSMSSLAKDLGINSNSLYNWKKQYLKDKEGAFPGKGHQQLGQQGIDRVFTNNEENRCSRETMGDRWDAWRVGYNEIFSPYSSPNTKDRNNNNTGIFVYYKQKMEIML